MYIHLDTLHARNLKFGMYLPCMTFNRFNEAILKKNLFGLIMATKNPIWPPFLAHFCLRRTSASRANSCIQLISRKGHAKFQSPSMYGV